MAGIPVLVSNMLEMGRLTREHSIGFVLNDNTPDALVEQLKEIAVADLKVYDQAVDQFRRIYNWETQRQKFVALYQGLIEARA
jgi:glycosyltransferase involved in cell wall biosynthesis